LVRDADSGSVIVERAGRLGIASNNVAEYHSLIAGLELVAEYAPDGVARGADGLQARHRADGRPWKVKHPDMRPLALRARPLAPGRHHLDVGAASRTQPPTRSSTPCSTVTSRGHHFSCSAAPPPTPRLTRWRTADDPAPAARGGAGGAAPQPLRTIP
jgi:hypothetical protein